MNKYIYKLMIAFSAIFSLLCIGIISLCIIIVSNKTITIQDYSQYVSKVVSWYLDQEIFFEQIQIHNSSMHDKYELKIKNIIIKEGKNYKNLEIQKLNLDIYPINLFNKNNKFSKIDIENLSVDYISDKLIGNDLKLTYLDDLFKISDVLNISNSLINIYIDDRLYYLSNINLKKLGIDNLNINGSFIYRDNYFQTIDKLLEFSSTQYNNQDIVNIKFKDIIIDEIFVNKFININNFSIEGAISGELRLIFINSLFSNIDFNIISKNILVNIKNKIQYENLVINKIPVIDIVQLRGSYYHKLKNFQIDELNFKIININAPDSSLKLTNYYNSEEKNNEVKLSFINLNITKFISIESYGLNSNIFRNISGNGNIILDKYNIISIDLNIDNILNDEISIKNITYYYNNNLEVNKLFLSLSTKYKTINKLFSHYNIFQDRAFIKFNAEDKINLDAIIKIKNGTVASIDGNIFFDTDRKLFINRILLKSANFKINYNKQHIDISALLNTNISDIKISFKKDRVKPAILNFSLPIINRKITDIKYITDLMGESLLQCSLIFLKIKNYTCSLNLVDSSFSIPFLNYKKNIKEDAMLDISGDLSESLKFFKIKFNYQNIDNILMGNLSLSDTNKSFFVDLNKFIFKKNNLKLGAHFDNNKLILDLYSGTLDLNTFLNYKSNDNNLLDISLEGKLDKIFIKDFTIDDAILSYKNNKAKKVFNLIGNYYTDESINFNYYNTQNRNILSYDFKASNAGKFFDLLNYNSEIKDGILSSQGFIGDLDDDNSIMGTLSIDNFKVMKTPLIAELLIAASFTGLFELLNNKGIEFEQLDAQFTGKNNIYNISKSRAYGISLGITGAGKIDNTNKSLELSGSIIPAYKINSLLNNIPLVGQLLTAKEDEGLFAINYNASGSWSSPKIIVNPLSLLTPGIIRNIFN